MPNSALVSQAAPSQSAIRTVDQALRAVPLLHDLEDRVMVRLAAISSIVEAADGTELCQQGQPADRLYVVLEGQLAAINTAPNGETAVVEVIRPGETLGLSTVLAGLPRLVSVRTITPCRLLSIDAESLMALVAQETSLVTTLLRAEAKEFRAMVRQVCDLKLRTTAQRLGCYL